VSEATEKIYKAGSVTGRSGKTHQLHSAIDREEGELLSSIIRDDPTIVRTLEVGCAYGLSSLYICSAMRERAGASHTIIDPFQNSDWDGAGIKNLEAEGLRFFDFIEERSEFALPRLLERAEGRFDFIFIDGWHTFDHTLLDCFYATRLLRVGGYLVIDDMPFPAVRRAVDFVRMYPCYEFCRAVGEQVSKSWKHSAVRRLLSPVRREVWSRMLSRHLYRRIFDDQAIHMIVLKKVTEDRRAWNWHDEAF
jgi:predicted O-methyltransferase YrrM